MKRLVLAAAMTLALPAAYAGQGEEDGYLGNNSGNVGNESGNGSQNANGPTTIAGDTVHGGTVVLEGSTDSSVYRSSSKYEIPQAPVMSAVAPDLTPTAPCLVATSGAVQTHLIGISGAGYKLDEECNRRMNQQQQMDVALRLKHAGMDALGRRVLLELDVVREVLAKDGLTVFKGRVINVEELPQWEKTLGKLPRGAKYGGDAIESKGGVDSSFTYTPTDGG